jgi:hypothetical protein
MSSLEQDGFEIIPDVISEKAILTVGESLRELPVRRTSAGIRNALRIPAVRSLAMDEKLVNFAKQVLGEGAIPFRALCSISLNNRIGWSRGTRIQCCRCANGEIFPVGVHGRSKKG